MHQGAIHVGDFNLLNGLFRLEHEVATRGIGINQEWILGVGIRDPKGRYRSQQITFSPNRITGLCDAGPIWYDPKVVEDVKIKVVMKRMK